MLKLRAHHLLCLSRFHNCGWYDKKFCGNFKSIFKKIKEHPNQIIKIKRSCDDLCKKCPYVKNNICNKPSKYKISHWVKVMDNKTMRLIKIKPNSVHKIKDIFRLVINKISDDELRKICKGCEYLTYCLNPKKDRLLIT